MKQIAITNSGLDPRGSEKRWPKVLHSFNSAIWIFGSIAILFSSRISNFIFFFLFLAWLPIEAMVVQPWLALKANYVRWSIKLFGEGRKTMGENSGDAKWMPQLFPAIYGFLVQCKVFSLSAKKPLKTIISYLSDRHNIVSLWFKFLAAQDLYKQLWGYVSLPTVDEVSLVSKRHL